jgi:hypothetical protein
MVFCIRLVQPRTFLFFTLWERITIYPSATQMFQFPSLIVMTIASTRMYRGLSEFVFGYTATDMYYFPLLLSSLALTVYDDSIVSPMAITAVGKSLVNHLTHPRQCSSTGFKLK